jgi:hypothetical protein
MIALRFTKEKNEFGRVSTDTVNNKKLSGLCAYDITAFVDEWIEEGWDFEDAVQIAAKKQAEFDNWHATNHGGQFVIFDGEFLEYDRDNQDFEKKRAVVAEINFYYGHGRIEQCAHGYKTGEFSPNNS